MHVSQIDPRLFNPTSSELAGALTLPPLDSNADSQGAYSPTSAQTEQTGFASSTARSAAVQSRYCSVKGCRNVIGGDYLFKMCVPCRNRYRGYGMTKRSKWKRGREIAAQELERIRVEEDTRRARQGLPVSCVQLLLYPIDTLPRSLLASSKLLTAVPGRGRFPKPSLDRPLYNMYRYPCFQSGCARCHTAIPCCKDIIPIAAASGTVYRIGTTANSNACETKK